MKTTKKLAGVTLAAVCTLCAGAAIAGCTQPEAEHTHTFEEQWTYSDTDHWHKCEGENCTEVDGFEKHTLTETNTATCTADGEKTVSCSVCGYSVSESVKAYGHDWDEGKETKAATHLAAGETTFTCKREGCGGTKTEPIPQLSHTYEWTYKDHAVHTGVCTGEDCGEVAPVEAPHNFMVTSKNKYRIYTCEDCGAELAEYSISLVSNTGTQYMPYLDSAVKVALYTGYNGTDAPEKLQETTVDTDTGVATFLVEKGSYQVAIDDPAGYLHNDAPFINVNPDDEYSDSSLQLVVSAPAEYTLKLYYGAGEANPASDIDVLIRPKSANNPTALPYASGKTNADGEFKFKLGSDFGARYSRGTQVVLSGYDKEAYQLKAVREILINADSETTLAVHLEPAKLNYTVKVKAGEEFVKGLTVKFSSGMTEVKEVTMDAESDTAVIGELANNGYMINVSGLPAETEANYKLPEAVYADYYNGDIVIEMIKKSPTYVGTVSGTGLTEKSGIKVLLKDDEGNTVGEATTDEEGKVYIECPDPVYNYHVCIDKSTMPEGFAYYDSQFTGINANPATNTKNSTITLLKVTQMEIAVTGADDNSNITVKLYLDNALAFEGITDENGKVAANIPDMRTYKVVLENLPANVTCEKDTFMPMAEWGMIDPIKLVPAANYKLTFVDEQGEKVAGATVQLGSVAWSSRNARYDFTKAYEGITDENGLLSLTYRTGSYVIEVTGANGEKYYTNFKAVGDTAGQNVEQTVTLHSADNAFGYGASAPSPAYGMGELVNKTTVFSISNKRDEEFSFGGLTAGKYEITLINPDNAPVSVNNFKCGYDFSSGWTVITDDNEFVKFNRDGEGNIVSFTYNYDGTSASQIRFSLVSSSADITKMAISVRAVTE